MQLHTRKEEDSIERKDYLIRIVVCAVVVLVLLLAVVGNLIYLQLDQYDYYHNKSNENAVRDYPIPPARGRIFDRNGASLAINITSNVIEVIPEQVEDMDKLLADIRQYVDITENEERRFKRTLRQGRRAKFEPVILKQRVGPIDFARISANKVRVPGVRLDAKITRYYPLRKVAGHTVGYVGRVDTRMQRRLEGTDETDNYAGTTHYGKTGIEEKYERLLHGTVGTETVETDAFGRKLRTIDEVSPVRGADIFLSLDIRLQVAAEQAMEGVNGVVAVMDARTGQILALVSNPSYDTNLFVNGISSENYAKLRNDDVNTPLYNRALQGTYPPGSTVKPFLALAGMHYNVAHRVTHKCNGKYVLKLKKVKRVFRDWKRTGHGKIDMERAIAQSCDIYYYDLARRLRIDRIHQYLTKFGFGEATGVDLVGEKKGNLPARDKFLYRTGRQWPPGQTLNAGIGQGFFHASVLQILIATNALATDGEVLQPKLVHFIRQPDGETKFTESTVLRKISIPARDRAKVLEAMRKVVHDKTGTAFSYIGRDMKYTMAGKTGTSQVKGLAQEQKEAPDIEDVPYKERDHALFMGFAPMEDPKISIVVVAEHSGSGGKIASPIARRIADYYMLNLQAGNR